MYPLVATFTPRNIFIGFRECGESSSRFYNIFGLNISYRNGYSPECVWPSKSDHPVCLRSHKVGVNRSRNGICQLVVATLLHALLFLHKSHLHKVKLWNDHTVPSYDSKSNSFYDAVYLGLCILARGFSNGLISVERFFLFK